MGVPQLALDVWVPRGAVNSPEFQVGKGSQVVTGKHFCVAIAGQLTTHLRRLESPQVTRVS